MEEVCSLSPSQPTPLFTQHRYCTENGVGEWHITLELSREIMIDFVLFVYGNYKIQSWGTSLEYICQFQQLYTTVTGRFVDRNDARELYKVCLRLYPILFGGTDL